MTALHEMLPSADPGHAATMLGDVTGTGMLDAFGEASIGYAVPAVGPLVGATVYVQSLVGAPLAFTNVERLTFSTL